MDPQTELININLSILGLRPGASFEDVQIAYRRQMKKWHPDLHMGSEHAIRQASELAKAINAAYDWIRSNRGFLESLNDERRHSQQTSLLVDKFVFGEDWCEEEDIDRPIDLIEGVSPNLAIRLADTNKFIPLVEGLANCRNFRYLWCNELTGRRGQAIRSRVDFARRHVFVNLGLNPRLKIVLLTGALLFFRDMFHYGGAVGRKYTLGALRVAGWTNEELFKSRKYFESELIICGAFSGRFLLTDRAAGAEPEGAVEQLVNDFSAWWFPKSVADYSRYFANRFRYDGSRSLAYPFSVNWS